MDLRKALISPHHEVSVRMTTYFAADDPDKLGDPTSYHVALITSSAVIRGAYTFFEKTFAANGEDGDAKSYGKGIYECLLFLGGTLEYVEVQENEAE